MPPAPALGGVFGVRSIGVWLQRRRLSSFLGGRARFVFLAPGVPAGRRLTGMAGWGLKGPARGEAQRLGLPYLALEDGFLRTAGLGGRDDPSLSLTADMTGVHYDCHTSSDLETLIADWRSLDKDDLRQAAELMTIMRQANLGKFNGAPDADPADPVFADGPPVFVVDQIARDQSIAGGGCDGSTFAAMLDAAIAENPGSRVVARVHPFDGIGGRRGHLKALAAERGVAIYAANVSWMSAAKLASRVYVATSHAGLEALIAGAEVTCFGLPAYAGWGLTDDRQACPRRAERPSLEAVVAAIYLRYSRYLSPLDGRPCSGLEVARLLAARRRRDVETAGPCHVLGVHPWKRRQVRPFVEGKRSAVTWSMDPNRALAEQARSGGRIVAWSSRAPEDFAARCAAQDAPLVRMEDGFLRSVGLGANLELPGSLVLDATGVYYDPGGPSDLETLLQTTKFDQSTRARAAALRQAISRARVSKYNVGSDGADYTAQAAGRARILVPAQVADDASVVKGGGRVKDNLALLQAARAARPDAFIIYKPHPDVEAGIRVGGVDPATIHAYADAIAEKASIVDLLDNVDEVHTLTSLAGFEALLRGVPVWTYGMPFYAGWGLTHDAETCPRRTRQLNLDDLVAGVLIVYPRYVHRGSEWPCEAEDVVRFLAFSLLKTDPRGLIEKRRRMTLLRQLLGKSPN